MRRNRWLTVAATSMVAVAGCGGSSNSTNNGGAPSGRTDILAAGAWSPDSLDPDPVSFTSEQLNGQLMPDLNGYLMAIDPTAESAGTQLSLAKDLKPSLATNVVLDPSQSSYTVRLRSDVMSTAGHPLVAQDVDWTFHRIAAAGGVGALLMVLGNIDAKNPTTVIDDHTVRINLGKPSPILQGVLQTFPFGILDSTEGKAHATASDPFARTWFTTNTAGFGPYIVSQFAAKQQVTLVPNPHWWGTKVQVTKVVWKAVPDGASRLQLVQGGSANFAWQVPANDYQNIKNSSTVDVSLINAPLATRLVFNTTTAPFNDPRVRQAVTLAIDRSAIANGLFPGAATPATSCSPGNLPVPGFANFLPNSGDVTKAKQLLSDAGVSSGLNISMAVNASGGGGSTDQARLIQSQLAAVGITVAVNNFATFDEYLKQASSGTQQMLLEIQNPFVADAGFYLEGFLTASSPINYGKYNNPAFDALAVKSMTTLGSERDTALKAACDLHMVDNPEALLVNTAFVNVTSKGFHGLYDYPDYALRFADVSLS